MKLSFLLQILLDQLFVNSGRKKKRGQRAVGGDKSGRGLRQFSMKGVYFTQMYSLLVFV